MGALTNRNSFMGALTNRKWMATNRLTLNPTKSELAGEPLLAQLSENTSTVRGDQT